ncbi:MAG: hypothetical protein IK080_09680, partial [Clostridia bacterium]|nr:hypothetical protein [Clostridia bacterium]
MKTKLRQALTLLLCAAVLCGLAAPGLTARAASYKTGDIIEFGSYPQTDVTASMGSTLNAKAGGWKSYGYYSGTGDVDDGQMTAKDYMMYCDVKIGNAKYRGVKFDTYRPDFTEHTSSSTYQDDNGYTTGTTYWFKYEPLKWRVLDASTGLVMCETIIDSQPYNNYFVSYGTDSHGNTAYWGDSAKTYYASDYANSSIRKWLTEDFYATAFSQSQQAKIKTTTLNNDGYRTLTGQTGYKDYDSASTKDKIFLLSYDEVLNSSYGFSTSYSTYDSARQAKGSDYAKCQGLYVYHSSGSSYDGCSYWRLRSPGYYSNCSCYVDYGGYVDEIYATSDAVGGVRPAFKLNLSSLGAEPATTAQPATTKPVATTKPTTTKPAATTTPAATTKTPATTLTQATLPAIVTAPTSPDGSGTVQLDGQEYALLRFEDFSYILEQLEALIVQYLG